MGAALVLGLDWVVTQDGGTGGALTQDGAVVTDALGAVVHPPGLPLHQVLAIGGLTRLLAAVL